MLLAFFCSKLIFCKLRACDTSIAIACVCFLVRGLQNLTSFFVRNERIYAQQQR